MCKYERDSLLHVRNQSTSSAVTQGIAKVGQANSQQSEPIHVRIPYTGHDFDGINLESRTGRATPLKIRIQQHIFCCRSRYTASNIAIISRQRWPSGAGGIFLALVRVCSLIGLLRCCEWPGRLAWSGLGLDLDEVTQEDCVHCEKYGGCQRRVDSPMGGGRFKFKLSI